MKSVLKKFAVIFTAIFAITVISCSDSNGGGKTDDIELDKDDTVIEKPETPETSETPVGELQSITIKTPPKLYYEKGKEFDPEGMVVIASYKNDSEIITRKIEYKDLEIEGFDSSKSGVKSITVSYKTCKDSINLYVGSYSLELSKIEATVPKKVDYVIGESFDYKGINLSVYYGDNTKILIEENRISYWLSAEYDFSVPNAASQVTLTFTAGKESVSKTITVRVHAKLESIEITTKPTKTNYILSLGTSSEKIDVTGMVVKAKYSDGSVKTIENSKCTISPDIVAKSDSRKTITVSYTENGITKNATFNVTVKVDGDSGLTL